MSVLPVLALTAVALALLCVPADLSLEMERKERLIVVLGFRWMFISARKPLTLPATGAKKEPEGLQHRRTGVPLRTLVEVGKVPGLATAIRRFLARLARSVRVLKVAGRIRLGASDPADTGRLWSFAWPATVWFNRWPQVDLSVEPDFSGACLAGTLGATVRIHPARLAYGIGTAALSMTTIRLVSAVLKRRWSS